MLKISLDSLKMTKTQIVAQPQWGEESGGKYQISF